MYLHKFIRMLCALAFTNAGITLTQVTTATISSNGAISGRAGRITGTSATGRQPQFALKLLF